MSKQKFLQRCDQISFGAYCALIFFLPISIALVESFFSVLMFMFIIKRSTMVFSKVCEFKRNNDKRPLGQKATDILHILGPAESFLNRPIGLFIFVCFLSVITSQYHSFSIIGFVFKLLEWAYLYFFFVEIVNSRKRLIRFFTVYMFSALIIVTNGFYQLITNKGFIFGHLLSEGRISSSFRHSNDFGGYLVILCLLSLSIALMNGIGRMKKSGLSKLKIDRSRKQIIFFGILFVIFTLTLGWTLSRGAWVGFFAGLIMLAFRKKRVVYAIVIIFIIFIACFTPKMNRERNTSLFSHITYASGSGRSSYWKESWLMIRDFPIFGTGLNTYSQVGPKYKITWGGYPHNCYLQMTVEIGLVGLATFLWFIFSLFRTSMINYENIDDPFLKATLLGLLAGSFGFLTHSFFDTNFYSVQLGNNMWIVFGIIVVIQKLNVNRKIANNA